MRAPLIEIFLAEAGWPATRQHALAGDASARRYVRVQAADRSAVLMIAPVRTDADRYGIDAFLRLSALLREAGLCAPQVFAAAPDQGLILMQDFGDLSLSRLLEQGHATEAYTQAAAIPHHLAQIALPDWIATPDLAAQADMAALTIDRLPGSDDIRAVLLTGLQIALSTHAGGAPVLSLRDYHADNLIWRPRAEGIERVGLLDFQDAVALPMGYDLASLVDDPRRVVPDGLRASLIDGFAQETGATRAEALARIDTLSLLRNLRILGIFHRLSETGKPAYRAFLPRTAQLVDRAASNPALAQLRAPVSETLRRVAGWAKAGVS